MIKWTLFNNGVGLIIKKINRRVIVAITKLLEVDNSSEEPSRELFVSVTFKSEEISVVLINDNADGAGTGSKWITLIILK